MTTILLKRETSKSLQSAKTTPTAFEGFLLRVEVDKARGITPDIFVMQRDVNSAYAAGGVLDSFYSVASVGEIEWIPSGAPDQRSTNFFRTDKIELIFETEDELSEAWDHIQRQVVLLAKANDITHEVAVEDYHPVPSDSLPLYYGFSPEDSFPSGEAMKSALTVHPEYTHSFATNVLGLDTEKYLWFFVHETLGSGRSIYISNAEVESTAIELDVKSPYGDHTDKYVGVRTAEKVQPFTGVKKIEIR